MNEERFHKQKTTYKVKFSSIFLFSDYFVTQDRKFLPQKIGINNQELLVNPDHIFDKIV